MIENVQSDSVTGIVSIIGFTVIFFTISIGLITSAASVMYILPDAIFSFMGASSSATSQAGRDVERGVDNSSKAGIGAAVTRKQHVSLRDDPAIREKMKSLKGPLDAGVRGADGSTGKGKGG